MNIIKYPTVSEYKKICERPHFDATQLNKVVCGILDDVRCQGDIAVREYCEKFDKACIENLLVTNAEIEEAYDSVAPELRDAIILAHKNIKEFMSRNSSKANLWKPLRALSAGRNQLP